MSKILIIVFLFAFNNFSTIPGNINRTGSYKSLHTYLSELSKVEKLKKEDGQQKNRPCDENTILEFKDDPCSRPCFELKPRVNSEAKLKYPDTFKDFYSWAAIETQIPPPKA